METRNKSENIIGHCKTQKFIAGAFSGVVALWPASSRDWAIAMQSELSEIENPNESLRWLAGGIMSLMKAWWNRAIYGWKDGETEPSAVRTPGPVAFTIAVLAIVAFFALPSAHGGLSAVINSWPPYNNSNLTDFQRLTHEAEANRDAKTLAFLFTRTPYDQVEEGARLADEAIAIDPSLTWILYRGVSGFYTYRQITQQHGWIQKLEKFDPDNATPYLLEASVRQYEIHREYRESNGAAAVAPMEKVTNDSSWRAAMAKAFAAPNYDSYYDRAMGLQQAELKAHDLTDPKDVSYSVYNTYLIGFWGSQNYSQLLLRQAKEAQQKGDTQAAIRLGWTVVNFAQRARDNSHGPLMRSITDGALMPAYELLQPLEAAAGHAEVARLLTTQKEDLQRRQSERIIESTPYWFRPLNSTSLALHSAGLGMILFGGALVLSALILLMGRFAPALRSGRLYRWSCNCGRFAPAGFAASVVLMAAVFAPYLDDVKDFFSGVKDTATLEGITFMGNSLYDLPSRFFKAMSGGGLWEVLLVLAIIAGALFLSRNAFRLRAPRVTAA
jgi:hypothetical protein